MLYFYVLSVSRCNAGCITYYYLLSIINVKIYRVFDNSVQCDFSGLLPEPR